MGASLFDIERFGAIGAYTIDGSELGELQAETFTASEVVIVIEGVEVHPGFAYGKLVNAARLAARDRRRAAAGSSRPRRRASARASSTSTR